MPACFEEVREVSHPSFLNVRIEAQRPLRHREPRSGVAIQSRTEKPAFVILDCHVASLLAMTNNCNPYKINFDKSLFLARSPMCFST